MSDKDMNEACGVFGCIAAGTWPTQLEVANIICLGLIGLQHRGQESAGITVTEGDSCYGYSTHKGMGLVSQVFTEHALSQLKGNIGIGHTRYSTSGKSDTINCQPFIVETLHGHIAVSHNGELVNAQALKQKILRSGVGLTTGTDSELITQVLALPPKGEVEKDGEPDWVARIKQLMELSMTSYSILMMHKDFIYAVRDPFGNRPLCIGKVMPVTMYTGSKEQNESNEECEGWVVSSESCSFQSTGAKYYREILPGEIVRIGKEGIKSMCIVPRPEAKLPAFCIFEYVYFARPDSIFEGQMVYSVRQRCGRQLAIEAHIDADLVSTVPESATPAAIGYSQQSGIPYVEILCKNRYVGRTFIQPTSRLRQLGVSKKFGALSENIKGKRIVLLDDSIVRGNTMVPIIRLIRSAGAKEVHVRVASPPLKHPCYMGIAIPTKEELIANKLDLSQLADHLGADSVVYLSVDGLVKAVQSRIPKEDPSDSQPKQQHGHCVACLTGTYPIDLNW